MNTRPDLFLVGMPGDVGGAATKIAHLIRLLHRDFSIKLVLPEKGMRKEKRMRRFVEPFGVPVTMLRELPKKLDGVALIVCIERFFTSGMAKELKNRGARVVWSNEMMFAFKGEEEAAREGIVDRVLWVSKFQQEALGGLYDGVSERITGNYIDPDDFSWHERRHPVFTLGRLSRADPRKYPFNFPVFYEELRLPDARFRVMAWNEKLHHLFRWHVFSKRQWELLPANKEPAREFLNSLDIFLYPLGNRFKESWGRAVVEAMLTGCVPVVSAGHQFHKLMIHGESGFICQKYSEYKEAVWELYENFPYRLKISRQCAEYARAELCNPEQHRETWVEALSF